MKEEPSADRPAGGQSNPEPVGFAGGSPGVNALVSLNPATGYTVIVLSNYDPRNAENIDQQVRKWLGGISK